MEKPQDLSEYVEELWEDEGSLVSAVGFGAKAGETVAGRVTLGEAAAGGDGCEYWDLPSFLPMFIPKRRVATIDRMKITVIVFMGINPVSLSLYEMCVYGIFCSTSSKPVFLSVPSCFCW